MLSIAGNHCDDSILCMTVDHVTKLTELHSFVVHKLFGLLRDELPRAQIALVHLAVWCIGEYGDHLLMPCNADNGSDYTYYATSADEILGLLEAIIRSHIATELTKSYVLTALMKLSNYLNEGKAQSISLVNQFNSSLSLELHQRSCEYIFLLDSRWQRVLPSTFARTPAAEQGTLGPDKKGNQGVIIADKQAISLKARAEPHEKTPTDLLDFDTILEGAAGAAGEEANIAENLKTDDIDLLCNISPGAPFGGPSISEITAYQKSGLLITMHLVNDFTHSSIVNITCKFSNQTHQDLEKFIFQAAVPKYVTMEMKPASSSCVRANSLKPVTQEIKLNNTSPTKPLKMLIKIQYNVGGHLVVDQVQVAEFPPSA
jgi:AP-1 complex subunit gamma-1